VTWWLWRRKIDESQEAVLAAEELRDLAQRQQRKAEAFGPRVDAVTSSLGRLRLDDRFGPVIDAILRSGE